MSFDPLVANAGRLRILTALAVEETQEFVQLRQTTQLTDGNLASHARRLHTAGMIAVEKHFREGKPVTSFALTTDGRKALEQHTRRLIAAISHRRLATPPLQSKPVGEIQRGKALAPIAIPAPAEDDWVD
jgi:DNA-binding MarR family transcriptional regulator